MLGDNAIAEIGATAALYGLITNIAFGFNNGLALSVSRNFGAGEAKEVKRSVCWMTILSTSLALLMTVLFLLFQCPLLTALQVPEDTMQGAMAYLTIILAGIPFSMAYNLEAGLLQAVGNSTTPLVFLLFSSLLNVILDVLFLRPLHFGIAGAAAATILSQAISAALGLWYLLRFYPDLHFDRSDLAVSRSFVTGMLWTGVSMALMSAIYNIGSVVLQGSINALGNLYITAQVGGRRLAEFFYTPGLALGTAAATYTSQNYGAGKPARIRKGVLTAIGLYGLWWLVAMAFTFLLAPQAVALITGSSNPEVIANGVLYLRVSIPMVPPMAVLVILRNALQGMQHTLSPLLCSTLELAGKVVFALFLVPVYGYIAVCICEPVTWVICCIFILIAVFLCKKEFRDPVM